MRLSRRSRGGGRKWLRFYRARALIIGIRTALNRRATEKDSRLLRMLSPKIWDTPPTGGVDTPMPLCYTSLNFEVTPHAAVEGGIFFTRGNKTECVIHKYLDEPYGTTPPKRK